MTIATVRRLAADILNVGQNKVRIDPENVKEAEGALTRADVRSLIDKGIISRAKHKGRASRRKAGRRGRGRRRGTPVDSKRLWMSKIRSQRRLMNALLESGALKTEAKRSLYGKVKSGIFRNKRAMLLYLKDNSLIPVDYEPAKQKHVKSPRRGGPQRPHAPMPGNEEAGGKKAAGSRKEEAPHKERSHAKHAAKEKGERK